MNRKGVTTVKNPNKKVREPLLRIARRDTMPLPKRIGIRGIAIVLSLIVSAIVIFAITKYNPIVVYEVMFEGAFGTKTRCWSTIKETLMLTCIAVGLSPAFKMRFWNIGAEGQILVGGIVTAGCMIYLKNLPTPLLFLVMFVTSALAGAVWALFPAIFKAKWNTNETLFTLMMNYVAIQLTSFFVSKWENPFGSNTVGIINQNGREGWFPSIFGQQYLLNVFIVLILTVFMFIYLKYTIHGYEISVVGESENTARYAGINVKKVIIRTMLLSGAICGMAGFIAVSGASHTISTSTAGGRGFTAIIVAWLAKFNSFTMILISLLLAFLESGAGEIASKCKLNDYASEMVIGIILFFILGSEFFVNYRLIFRKKAAKEEK
ncbi:MAG TPA: ABC transporter permease [Lachnospiraceae bacterium]|nr:ABC transporter permease [Lachnospiraceae bacterium]HPF28601.1 ABC transporter permease [Lachnospiraceae bacterium]